MREIDINIEGYNVNGICVGCLNYNRKMFYCKDIKDCFKVLANIDVPDGLTVQVCWECLAAVRNTLRFQSLIIHSYNILSDYSKKHTFLNSPFDLSQYAAQRLTSVLVDDNDPFLPVDVPEIEPEIKVENEDKYKFEIETQPIKEELPSFDIADDYPSQDGSQDDVTSDDDIQLSKLKREKEQERVKKKRKEGGKKKKKEEKEAVKEESRRLKNLPSDIVELYTMTEEEMWLIRSQDLEDKDFLKLKYKCEYCMLGFNMEKLMDYHMSRKHKPKSQDSLQCDVCKAYLLTKDNLSTHRSLHLTAYKCRECDYRTTLKRGMYRHVRSHTGGFLHCPTCGAQFSTKSKLSYHRSVCHQEKPQCDCCGKVFANKMTLKYHLNAKLAPLKDDKPKEKQYIPCKGCNKVFHSKKSYRAHVVIHEGVTYPCPICGKLFQWKRNLARHTRNHREKAAGALHECRECGKTFSSRDCYNNHMKLSKKHVPEHALGHQCSYCGKRFATKWCMVDHIDWDHLKRIKYQCSVCFKPFKTAKIMVAHINNIHEGKKNREPESEHLCEICGKSYKTAKRLKGHVWAMHTNRSTAKSYKCKLCPATFTWQTSIYKHTKMMHENKRTKQQRLPSAKKQESYPEIDTSHLRSKKQEPYSEMDISHLRMHYFPQGRQWPESQPPHQLPLGQNVV